MARRPASGNEFRSTIDQGKTFLKGGDFAQAKAMAEATIPKAQDAKACPRTLAELRIILAEAEFALRDAHAEEACEEAMRDWEVLPRSEENIAKISHWLGFILTVRLELRRAEPYLHRSIKLFERVHGQYDPSLLDPLYALLDLYDQECRVSEEHPLIERVQRIGSAHKPLERLTPFLLLRLRALVARREGNLDLATELLGKALETLPPLGASPNAHLRAYASVAYAALAEFALDQGRYGDMLRFAEAECAIDATRTDAERQDWAKLHFAYEANHNPELAKHDLKYALKATRGGGELFPAALPKVEHCVPETTLNPRGWMNRTPETNEIISRCVDGSSAPMTKEGEVQVLMRIENEAVVAAEAVGYGIDSSVLECAASRVIGVSVTGPHDFNFIRGYYFHNRD